MGSTSAAKDTDQRHQIKPADVKNINAAEPAVLFPPQPQQHSHVLAALAATQNFPLLGHSNPIYGSLLGSQISPVGATSNIPVTAVPTMPTSHVGVVVGGFGRANSTLLSQYVAGQGLQSLYPTMQIGQQPGAGRGQGTSGPGAFSGYPSYIRYGFNLLCIVKFSFYVCLIFLYWGVLLRFCLKTHSLDIKTRSSTNLLFSHVVT